MSEDMNSFLSLPDFGFWMSAMAVALFAAVLMTLPLLRSEKVESIDSVSDVDIYKDQLSEVDRDRQSGLIDEEQAAQAQAEVARRLIAATEKTRKSFSPIGKSSSLVLAALLTVLICVGGISLYGKLGMPGAPDEPLIARYQSRDPDINILIAKAEAHLAANPSDGKGWELLAPIYMRRMRVDEAIGAYRKTIELLGGNAERYGSLGEAMVAAAQGRVTPEAGDTFRLALQEDPANPRSRFYVAPADGQAGKVDQAISELQALAAESPKDAPWQQVVAMQIDRFRQAGNADSAAPGNPTGSDIQAAAGMSDNDRMQMIRTMVESLDARLKDNPNNFEGWMRLVRSYAVLNDPEKARDALSKALAIFPPDTDNGKALGKLAEDMGIPTEKKP